MKIVHIINSLEVGGAENVLLSLSGELKSRQHNCRVVALKSGGTLQTEFENRGIPVDNLGMTSLTGAPGALWSLARHLRTHAPDVVQTWMYHANLLGGLANRMGQKAPLAWNIRQTNVDRQSIKPSTRLVAMAGARLAGLLCDSIVVNSRAGARSHAAIGYDEKYFEIIPNGIDTGKFRPDETAARDLRRELDIGDDAVVLALPARFDMQKDHGTFFAAARQVLRQFPKVHIVLCGGGIVDDNVVFKVLMADLAGHPNIHLLGERRDMPRIYAGCDIGVSSSLGEGFSNTIAEMMACELPCVVTDVGDSATIAGEHGIVVPAQSADALGNGIGELIRSGAQVRREIGFLARQRIAERYSLTSMADKYLTLWRQLDNGRHG